MQVKTSLSLYLTLVRMSLIKKTKTNSVKDVWGKEPLYTVGENVN
jgi:hypothetical protein